MRRHRTDRFAAGETERGMGARAVGICGIHVRGCKLLRRQPACNEHKLGKGEIPGRRPSNEGVFRYVFKGAILKTMDEFSTACVIPLTKWKRADKEG